MSTSARKDRSPGARAHQSADSPYDGRVRILHLADDPVDSHLTETVLTQGGIVADFERVDQFEAFRAAVQRGEYALILSDDAIPGVDPFEALRFVRTTKPEIPYIFIAEALGEERAVEALKRGATDYVLKQRLDHRLVPSVREALSELQDRRERERAAAERLRQDEQCAHMMPMMFEHVALGIVKVDDQDRIVNVNDRFCKLLGYGKDELLGMTIHELTTEEDRPRTLELNEQRRQGRLDVFDYEKRYRKKDGSPFWAHVTVSAVRNASGRVQGAIGTVEDITDRKNAEERIRGLNDSLRRRNAELDAERMRWRGVVDSIADEMWFCDADGKMSLINHPDTNLLGLENFEDKSLDEVLEHFELMYPDGGIRPPEEAPLLRSLRHGEVLRGEEILRVRKSGRVSHRQFSCAPMRDAAGRITGAVAIVRDISEYKTNEQALREADHRKDEFLTMLSHELRNPLAPIRNSLYILDRSEPGSEQARRARAIIERQVDHMTRLVGDLLDVSRITRGKIQIQLERVNLSDLVSRTVEDHRPLFTARSVEMRLELPGSPIWIRADATRLAQALGNILQNAAKFTPQDGSVLVHLHQDGATGVLCVRDTGIGISADMMPLLFQPFTQADRSLDRSSGGLGLGLSLVKGLIELHGGEVRARSDGPGRGAEFVIRLPVEVDLRRGQSDRPEKVMPSSRRVLVIEDNVDSAESLKEVLELDAHEVEVAFSGPEGVTKAQEFSPDVVLCDIGLPGMDGYGVARALRADPRLQSTYLVALSGYALQEDIEKSKAAGFDRHMAKPPDIAVLEKTLAEVQPRYRREHGVP